MHPDPYRLSILARLRVWAAPALLQARDLTRACIEDIPLLTRIASHVGLLVLMLFTIAASSVRLGNGARTETSISGSPDDPFLDPGPDDFDDNNILFFLPNPVTNVPKRIRNEVTKYTVQPGDTVSDIAEQFDVSADSILWANAKLEDNPDMLALGQTLNIPPANGVLYTVAKGDTVQSIATKFKSAKYPADKLAEGILSFEFNQENHDLKSDTPVLTVGQFLMVPNGYKAYQPRVAATYGGAAPSNAARGSGNFGWPVGGRITQRFYGRHTGIDIATAKGTPVRAADAGYVITAGWDNERVSYGFMILINHGNGYVTRYAHLSALDVDVGQSVKKGQVIGRVGSTGNSTGPHLHFEILRGGKAYNPFSYLH